MANFTIPFVTVLQPVNYDRAGPGYSTVVAFMCTCINRHCKRATIIIKSGPMNLYMGGTCPECPPGSVAASDQEMSNIP